MDYDLSRVDYAICGITYPDTLKILPPPGQKLQQKFAVGDKNGVLHCLSIKDEEPVVQFKTLPGKPITAVQLAYTAGSQADKIFTASGNEVKGYTRKGKVFLTIETPLSETITSMCIMGSDLILCSGRTVTYYRDLNEFHSYTCDDRVLDIAAFAAPNSTRIRLLVLIANKGAAILDGGQMVARTAISSGPSRLAVPPSQHFAEVCAFYGAADGSIGLITYEESLLSTCLVEGRGLGSVVCVGWFMGNGGTHLAIGRNDGSIQLYLLDLENIAEKPRLKFTYFCGEPVTSVEGGCVGTEEWELLAATYSGRIFALRTRRLVSGITALANLPQDALIARRAKLETEVARLEKQTAHEREKYQRNTRSLQAGLSTPPLLDIQLELSGATNDGWQEANIISAVPLDMLFIYCAKRLDLQTDNAAVLSICPSQGTSEDLLATVRCQAGTRRLWMKMRYLTNTESPRRSESLRVLIYALPSGAPRVARCLSLKLPSLPYYSQHEDPDCDSEKRPWCHVRITGSFSVAELTSWLSEALPGEMPRPATNIAFARSHTLLGTILICQYQRGSGTFKTDDVSTAAIVRDIISNCSAKKSIRMEITCDVPDDCCIKCFQRIQEQFTMQHKQHEDHTLKTALRVLDLDVNAMDEENPVLCEDYLRVWATDEDDTLKIRFNEYVDIVEQWFKDWCDLSLHRKDSKKATSELQKALRECRVEQILKILGDGPSTPHSELEFNKVLF